MPADKEITKQRHQLVKDEFLRLSSIKKDGVPLYSKEYCIKKAAEKGFYKISTAERIIFSCD